MSKEALSVVDTLKLALEALVKERTNYEDWDKEDGAPEYIYGAINAIERALERRYVGTETAHGITKE